MNKNIVIGIVAVIVVAGGIYLFTQNQNGANNTAPTGVVNPQTPSSTLSPSPVAVPVPAPTPAPAPSPKPTPAPSSVPVTHGVIIQNFSFNPSPLTIKKGDTVIWTNKDAVAHNVIGTSGGPSSPAISPNGTYSYTFNSTGTFGYYCSFHPTMPHATVVVTE
jgi:plastocyanin